MGFLDSFRNRNQKIHNNDYDQNFQNKNSNINETYEPVITKRKVNDFKNKVNEVKEVKTLEVDVNSKNQENKKIENINNKKEDKEELKENTKETRKNNTKLELDNNNVINRGTMVLTIINQKGGVGKSTTAINLSAALSELGKNVLIIDLDPQGNTTSGLGIEKSGLKKCVYDVLLKDYPIDEVSKKNVYKTVDVVPATINLAGAEVELVNEIARENRLKDAIQKIKAHYDYIFIDCPPSLGLLTINALVAADKLFIPIQTEFYALEGVTKLLDSMKRVKARLNTNLDIFGVLLTMYDGRTILAKQVADEVYNYFKDLVFEVKIPRTVKISEAPSFGQPITQYEPDNQGAKAYIKLAKEVISRG